MGYVSSRRQQKIQGSDQSPLIQLTGTRVGGRLAVLTGVRIRPLYHVRPTVSFLLTGTMKTTRRHRKGYDKRGLKAGIHSFCLKHISVSLLISVVKTKDNPNCI